RRKRLSRSKKRSPIGAQPGLLAAKPASVELSCHIYDANDVQVKTFNDFDSLKQSLLSGRNHWLAIDGPTNPGLIASLASLGFHSLALEDISHGEHRPQYEQFDTFDF